VVGQQATGWLVGAEHQEGAGGLAADILPAMWQGGGKEQAVAGFNQVDLVNDGVGNAPRQAKDELLAGVNNRLRATACLRVKVQELRWAMPAPRSARLPWVKGTLWC
jgi:hypothetical protein